MRNKVLMVFIMAMVFIVSNCQDSNIKKNKNMNTPIYKIKLSISIPYELYVNDFLIDRSFDEEGAVETNLFINNFILKSGIQTIVLKMYPKRGENHISDKSLDFINVKIVELLNIDSQDSKLVKEFSIDKEKIINDKYIQEVKINVPYHLQGWSTSVELINENQEKLLKELQAFYQEVYTIINNGDYDRYSKIISKRTQEALISYYDSQIIKKEQEELKDRVIAAKGKMKPINFNQYELKIYGNGKLVTLEDSKGDSPLSYSTKEYKDYFGIILYRRSNNSSLEVIR